MDLLAAPDSDTIEAWMDLAIADWGGDDRLRRVDGQLLFGDDLIWDACLDELGGWYAHYNCRVPKEQYEPLRPLWSQHKKLYGEAALRAHVVSVVADFASN